MNNSLYRIIDANVNRASEGLRVCEDIARFSTNNSALTEKIRILRHDVRVCFSSFDVLLLRSRDAASDVGFAVSAQSVCDIKRSTVAVWCANWKRVQEALRSIEEMCKTSNLYAQGKQIEAMRFHAYTLEKEGSASVSVLLPAGIYGITASHRARGRDTLTVAHEMIRGGIAILQYREKYKPMKEQFHECSELRKMTADAGIPFIVNDHIDLACAVEADGVHIGQDDMPISVIRSIIPDMMVGLSTHSPQQYEDAVVSGADYVGVGPIFATTTKENVCAPVGMEYLQYAVSRQDISFVAIGGITFESLPTIIHAGARTIALVTALTESEDVYDTTKQVVTVYNETMEKIKGTIV